MANRVERRFSLSKQVTEEKIPELLKRKTSLQQTLETEVGGLQKLREARISERDVAQDTQLVKLESGESVELSSPDIKENEGARKLALFREQSYQELYELEKPFEGKPKTQADAFRLKPKQLTTEEVEDEERKD